MLLSPRSVITRFARHERGNVAIISAFVMLVLIAFAAGAVDFSRAIDDRQRLQVALDRALLAAAKGKLDDEDAIKAAVLNNFTAHQDWGDAVSNITIDIEMGEDSITGNLTADFRNTLLAGVWKESTNLGVQSQVKAGSRNIEIALVLDNTGSMASWNKIGILRDAAGNFVDEMEAVTEENDNVDISIGVVPFTTQVRIDTALSGEPWLGFASEEIEDNWQGCVWDRQVSAGKKRDSHVAIEGITLADKYPATLEAYATSGSKVYAYTVCEIAPVLDLTADYDAVRDRIDMMQAHPQGFTNVGLGLIWGWNLMDPAAPFTAASPYDDKETEKFIILLTDGDNTFNRRAFNPFASPTWTGQVGTYAHGQADKNTKDTCDNIKDTNIRVFTIRVVQGNETLLQNCATSASMYYNVKTPGDMNGVFEDIANRIKEIHLSM